MRGAHGQYRLECREGVLISYLFGSWNLEQAQIYFDAIKEAVAAFGDQPWCRVIDNAAYNLHTPDVTPLMRDMVFWSIDRGCIEQVYTVGNNVHFDVLDVAYRDAQLGFVVAQTVEEGVRYCQHRLRGEKIDPAMTLRFGGVYADDADS